MKPFTRHQIRAGAVGKEELGFVRVTDSPAEAMELIVRSQPPTVLERLKPLAAGAKLKRTAAR